MDQERRFNSALDPLLGTDLIFHLWLCISSHCEMHCESGAEIAVHHCTGSVKHKHKEGFQLDGHMELTTLNNCGYGRRPPSICFYLVFLPIPDKTSLRSENMVRPRVARIDKEDESTL